MAILSSFCFDIRIASSHRIYRYGTIESLVGQFSGGNGSMTGNTGFGMSAKKLNTYMDMITYS